MQRTLRDELDDAPLTGAQAASARVIASSATTLFRRVGPRTSRKITTRPRKRDEWEEGRRESPTG